MDPRIYSNNLNEDNNSTTMLSIASKTSKGTTNSSPKVSKKVGGLGLIEDAKLRAAGHFTDATQWNEVYVGNEVYTVERAQLLKAKINLDEIVVNPAYEKRPYKAQCALCKLYFEKSSVRYKVPNHRIIQLQREWRILKEGTRYNSGSFLYATSEVCVFCAQRFSHVDDEASPSSSSLISRSKMSIDGGNINNTTNDETNNSMENAEEDNILAKSKDTGMITISTKLERADITKEKGIRAYQSSVVDGMCAENAVVGLLARNEGIHVNSLLDHCKTRREVDPWWEVDLRRQRDIESLSFLISTGVQQKLYVYIMLLKKPIGFEDPFLDSVLKKAVVMKHIIVQESPVIKYEPISWTLPEGSIGSIIRIQLRGIHVLNIQNFCALQGNSFVPFDEDDLNATRNSYATLSMSMIKEAMADMMSPIQRRQRAFKNEEKKIPLEVGVLRLSSNINERYEILREWKERVHQHLSFFDKEEIVALYHAIFFVSVQNTSIAGKFDSSKNKAAKKWEDEYLWGDGILEHYPRTDFACLLERVRTVLRWIQTRSHPKILGPLLTSTKFELSANDPDEQLYLLTHALSAAEKLLIEKGNSSSSSSSRSPKKSGDEVSCSWGQFCIIMSLFFKQQCRRIGLVVYGVGKDDDVGMEGNDGTDVGGDSRKSPQAGKGGGGMSEQEELRDLLGSPNTLNASQSLPNITEGKGLGVSPSSSSRSPGGGVKRMTFKQAQLAFVTKRVKEENRVSFPKTLITDFKSYMDSQLLEGGSPKAKANEEIDLSKGTEERGSFVDNDDPLNLCRVCSLCNLKLPRSSVEIQVMWKHVIDLRKSWDPTLIPRSIEMMDQTISMFNLVRVCYFCSQFFDPDFDGGIAFPIRDSKTSKETGALVSINSQKTTSVKVPFYDYRYPMSLQTGDVSWQHRSIASRSRVRLAVAAIANSNSNSNSNKE